MTPVRGGLSVRENRTSGAPADVACFRWRRTPSLSLLCFCFTTHPPWRRTRASRSTRSTSSARVSPAGSSPSSPLVGRRSPPRRSSATEPACVDAANKNVFPRLCNPHGFTDADAYCAKGTGDVCCGLCPNNSVRGIFQLVWAIVSYGVASFTYTRASLSPLLLVCVHSRRPAPTPPPRSCADRGLGARHHASSQRQRVHCHGPHPRAHGRYQWGHGTLRHHVSLAAGSWLCVVSPRPPQAVLADALLPSVIFIMVPAILAPNWSRVGLSQKDMEERMRKEAKTSPTNARRSDVRAVEAALYKKHHDRWSLPILAFWCVASGSPLRPDLRSDTHSSSLVRTGSSTWCALTQFI